MKVLVISAWINTGVTSQIEYLVRKGVDVTVIIEEVASRSDLTDSPIWQTLQSNKKLHILENRTLSKSTRRTRVAASLILGLPWALKIIVQKLRTGETPRLGTVILETWVKNLITYKNLQYDVIHVHDGTTGKRIAELIKYGLLKGPYIVSVKGADICTQTPQQLNESYQTLFQTCDRVLGSTHFVLNHLKETNIDDSKLTRIPSTVNTEAIYSSRSPRNIANGLRLLNVARMLRLKGQRYAIEALAVLQSKGVNATLTIIGSGDEEQNLRELTNSLDLKNSIRFTGRLSHLDTLKEMEKHDILIHPCYEENGQEEAMGLVMLEAQLKGMLCVVSDSGGAPETVIHGKSGIVVPQKNVNAIAEAVRKLVSNYDLWPQYIKTGQHHVEKMYGAESQGRHLIELYKDIITHN